MKAPSDLGRCLMLAACAAALLLAAGTASHSAYRLRHTSPMPDMSATVGPAPTSVTVTTIALGGFRGLVADWLWLRSARLQAEGRCLELAQLADWITRLEPTFADVWEFQAWNLAYNVSSLMIEPEDRWRWVQAAIRLLRDRGIVANPGSPRLYCELAWLFKHKIGGATDPAHSYYKRMLALEMGPFVGSRADYDLIARTPAISAALKQTHKLDPDRMREVDTRYGPLDWRLPETHAIYWAHCARMMLGDRHHPVADRILYQSMVSLFLRGRVTQQTPEGDLVRGPAPELLKNTLRAFDDALAGPDGTTVNAGYTQFLRQATVLLALLGQEAEARQTFILLQTKFPSPEWAGDLETFVREQSKALGL